MPSATGDRADIAVVLANSIKIFFRSISSLRKNSLTRTSRSEVSSLYKRIVHVAIANGER